MKLNFGTIISFSVLFLAVTIKTFSFPIMEQLQLNVFDSFQQAHPRKYTPQPVRIVDIDDESLMRIGQWPWPRSVMSELTTKLNNHEASAIVFDAVFAEPDRTSPDKIISLLPQEGGDEIRAMLKKLPDNDLLFAESLEPANTISAFMFSQNNNTTRPANKAGIAFAGEDPKIYLPSFKGAVTSLPILENAAKGNGSVNSISDRDGVIRKVPLFYTLYDKIYPSLAAEALRVAQGASSYLIKSTGASGEETFGETGGITTIKIGNIEIPTNKNGMLWMHYSENVHERYIPAWKILKEDFDEKYIKGNIVFIGTSAAGLRDLRSTPLDPASSGVEVHVQALEQILSGEFMSRPDWMTGAEIVLIIITGLLLIFVMSKLPLTLGVIFSLATAGGMVGISFWAFTSGYIIDPITPALATIIVYLSASVGKFLATEREKLRIRKAFSHYMSPVLVDELAKSPDKLQLGGEIKELTIMFCDIRNFTSISEKFSAHGLTHFINSFLTPMTDVVLRKKGTIDKYIGDCIMAFWNAPLDNAAHAADACSCALEMFDELKIFNQLQQEEAKKEKRVYAPVNIGIGINTGECCVGNMGSEQRFDYSVLGDDVNLTSRLEGQTKSYGVNIIIGPETQKLVPQFATLELDLIRVKGKNKPAKIFALLGNESLKKDKDFREISKYFRLMLKAYRKKKWREAKRNLAHCKRIQKSAKNLSLEGLLSLYGRRINNYIKYPPSKKWVGIYDADKK